MSALLLYSFVYRHLKRMGKQSVPMETQSYTRVKQYPLTVCSYKTTKTSHSQRFGSYDLYIHTFLQLLLPAPSSNFSIVYSLIFILLPAKNNTYVPPDFTFIFRLIIFSTSQYNWYRSFKKWFPFDSLSLRLMEIVYYYGIGKFIQIF